MKRSTMVKVLTIIAMILPSWEVGAVEITAPVVLELYTSKSCSSCPPADRLMQEIAQDDPSVILLSFHVDYWDYLQWKDPFSSPDNTARQRNYSVALGRKGIYTPQLVVDGSREMVGSDASSVRAAIASAKRIAKPVTVAITPQAGRYQITITSQEAASAAKADIWLVRFTKYARTNVLRGENAGATIENIHNVTELTRLQSWTPGMPLSLSVTHSNEDGIVVIAQAENQGSILGAALAMNVK